MKRFFSLIIVSFILLLIKTTVLAKVPEVSFNYFLGNVMTNSTSQTETFGTYYTETNNNVSELNGLLFGMSYPLKAFDFNLEYGIGQTKDAFDKTDGFNLTEVKIGYWLKRGSIRFGPYLSWYQQTANQFDVSDILLGTDIRYAYNPKITLDGTLGYSLTTLNRQNSDDSDHLWQYRLKINYELTNKLYLSLGYRSDQYASTSSDTVSQNDTTNQSNLITLGAVYRLQVLQIDSVNPLACYNADSVIITIKGNYFQKGLTVNLIGPAQNKIPGTNIKLENNHQFSCGFDLQGCPPGSYSLTVTNPDGQNYVFEKSFTIEKTPVSPPIIKTIEPSQGFNNCNLLVRIYGLNFLPGASVSLVSPTGATITAENTRMEGPNQISCSLKLTGQPDGLYDVVVLNPDDQLTILQKGFLISGAPVLEHEFSKTLKTIYFNYNKAEILADQITTLEATLATLTEHPELQILLSGYADTRGNSQYNLALSRRRAECVRAYLVTHGINPTRITLHAYGSDHSHSGLLDESVWTQERRVDMVIFQVLSIPNQKNNAF